MFFLMYNDYRAATYSCGTPVVLYTEVSEGVGVTGVKGVIAWLVHSDRS